MSEPFHVLWTQGAQHDLDEIIRPLAEKNLMAALGVLSSIEQKAESLDSLPHRGRIVPELEHFEVREYRELSIPPYRLIYRVREQNVFVLGIFDERRDLEHVILRRLLSI